MPWADAVIGDVISESHSIHPFFINHKFKMLYQNYFKIQYFQMKEKRKN